MKLRSQAWQFHGELNDQGNQFQAEEVEDSLLGLARELLPDTPAAHWDAEWAHDLCKDALARLAKRYAEFSTAEREVLDFSAQEVWDERMHGAGLANDPVAFRAALDGWTRAGLEAIEQLRIRGVRHEFFEWYGQFEFGQRRTGNPGRQGGGEMERSPAWPPLPGTGHPKHREERRLGGAQRWHA